MAIDRSHPTVTREVNSTGHHPKRWPLQRVKPKFNHVLVQANGHRELLGQVGLGMRTGGGLEFLRSLTFAIYLGAACARNYWATEIFLK